MGVMKHELSRREHLAELGKSAARQAGAIKTCPHHEDIDIDQDDAEANKHAYAIATTKWKDGQVDGDREELMDAVKSAIDDSYDDCPYDGCPAAKKKKR